MNKAMLTLYGISNCDTIKKTRKLLEEIGIEYQFHDYKKLGCPTALVMLFLENFSHGELINTRGTTWRKLDNSVKDNLTEESAIELMSDNSSMIKRPLIHTGSKWLIGFDEPQLRSLSSWSTAWTTVALLRALRFWAMGHWTLNTQILNIKLI